MNYIGTETNITFRWVAFFISVLALAYLITDNVSKYDEKIQSVNRHYIIVKMENGKSLTHVVDEKEYKMKE